MKSNKTYRALSNIFILSSLTATIASFALMFASSIKYGGRNYYGDLGFIIGVVSAIPSVISIVMVAIRYKDATDKYASWLEKNKLLFFAVIIPLFVLSILLIERLM